MRSDLREQLEAFERDLRSISAAHDPEPGADGLTRMPNGGVPYFVLANTLREIIDESA